MAAGLGFKTFNTGDVLSASDVNGYLMQGVLVFASTAARDAAITSPAEGQFAFTKDTNSLFYYDGAAWVASGATGDIEGVTAGTGISGGGTSGTVTITNSMATAIDAKGDLVAGTGADTFARLAVGTNDQVLTADSTAATGLKWSTPSAGGSSFVGCRLSKSTAQAITTGTWTAVTWDGEMFDTSGFHDNSTNNTRITIPSGKAGYYLLNASLDFDANATGARLSYYSLNGSANGLSYAVSVAGSNACAQKQTNPTIVNLAVGDYVEFIVLHNVGSNLNFNGNGAAYLSEFSAQYLGA